MGKWIAHRLRFNSDLDKIKQEKMKLESLTRHAVNGNAVHDLYVDRRLFNHLQKHGFTYDSSVKRFKDIISSDDMNFYFTSGGLIEFPLTLMDAYLFTYMKRDSNFKHIFIRVGSGSKSQ